MSGKNNGPELRWLRWTAAPLLIVAIGTVQAAVFSRMHGAYETKAAERLPENPPEAKTTCLEHALAADPSNGWAWWMLSKQYLAQAQRSRKEADAYAAAAAKAEAEGNEQRQTLLLLARGKVQQERDGHLNEAKALALRGATSFNSVGCFKQLASVYLRKGKPEEAARYLQLVARIKPDDVEVIERLGLVYLNILVGRFGPKGADPNAKGVSYEEDPAKWDELDRLSDRILEKHPYSANAYFNKAFIARERKDKEMFQVYIRQAYLMMHQSKGAIFFNRQELDEIAKVIGVADEPAGTP